MHAYGHTRKDKQECDFGCCGTKSLKGRRCQCVVDKTNRKAARQLAAKEITETIETENLEINLIQNI